MSEDGEEEDSSEGNPFLVGVKPGDIVAVKVVEKGRIKSVKNYVSPFNNH